MYYKRFLIRVQDPIAVYSKENYYIDSITVELYIIAGVKEKLTKHTKCIESFQILPNDKNEVVSKFVEI